MSRIEGTLAAITVALVIAVGGCSRDAGVGERRDSGGLTASRGEHDRDESASGGDEGEEAGTELALHESYDAVRNGARLVLAYDAQSNSFSGTVKNTTDRTLRRVRVEVHLSNGKELGPTTPVDLAPGQETDVRLTAASKGFDRWTAHPEVGIGEDGSGEAHGEHDRGGRGEHRGEHR